MNKKIDYEKELNPAQLKAVYSKEGSYLVIAGAGSGKTRTLVYRVAYLVEQGISPEDILLLTFTRKAAEEMLKRASGLLDDRCRKIAGGTFHSFANMVLRRYAGVIGLSPDFTIMDRQDAEDTVNLIRTQLGFNKMEKRFPRKSAILDVISRSVNKSQKVSEVLYDEYPQFIEWTEEIRRIGGEYAKYKRAKSLLDYDDLLVYLRDLLENHAQARATLSKKYKYIMVDEYQDTNKLQAHIVCLLASEHKNVMVVGDDAQSIYSFRGADYRNIMDFPKIFPGTTLITLEENYRSTQSILDLTNQVISLAKDRFEKNLFTRRATTSMPQFIDARDDNAQSRFIAQKVLELREEGVELGQIAVLFRSGWHSNDLEIELANRNIPFVKYGGQKFVEAAHIKDIMSYLRITYNPKDHVSWYRALLLMRNIGPKTAEKIIQGISDAGIQGLDNKLLANRDLRSLVEVLSSIDTLPQAPSPEELISRFLDYYQPLLKEKYDDFNKRLNDLDSLQRIAARYASLEQFLTDMALEPPERSIVEAGMKDHDDSRLTLSTIHSAKGLEWHTVFMIYVAEGHMPSYLSMEDQDAIEEERRLFYVAATRAKENLFLLKPHIDRSPRSYFDQTRSVFTQVSRFLDDSNIMGKLVEVQEGQGQAEDFSFDEPDDQTPFGDMKNKEFLDNMKDYFRRDE